MKHIIQIAATLLLALLWQSHSFCQKYDYNWLGGLGSVEWLDTTRALLMKFEDEGIAYEKTKINFIFEACPIAMSDKDGVYQFSTNGNVVMSWNDSIMIGGKGFNKGATNDDFGTIFGDTVINDSYNPYTYQVIPDLYEDSVYYLIHSLVWEEADRPEYLFNKKTQISKIDMRRRRGRGEVVYKNRYFDEEEMGVTFALIQHGNGKDWWVVLRTVDGMEYNAILLRRDSVVTKVRSKIEGLSTEWFSFDDKFITAGSIIQPSRDGRYLVDNYGAKHVKWMGFDRCSGEVSLLDTIEVGLYVVDSNFLNPYFFAYRIFNLSPSGRFLYGAGFDNLAQWDLWADDIEASRVDMGHPWAVFLHADGQWQNGYGGFTSFGYGPDGKMYNMRRGTHSVVEHPDEKCPDCDFCAGWEQGPPPSCLGVEYKLYSGFYPNYRLGALSGSACDTIVEYPEAPDGGYGLSVTPSPASGPVTVEIALPSYDTGQARIVVVDMLGRVLYRHRYAPYAYLHEMDVSSWASGVYNVVLMEGNDLKASSRFVVIH